MTKLVKGFGIAVVAVALLVGVAAPSADALTQSEADVLITILGLSGADADAVNGLVSGGSSSSSSSSCAVTSLPNLTVGSSGADVTTLQTYLVDNGNLVIPAGVSMGYFGSLTQAGVASLQAANGVSPASGYFGPLTRASISCDAGSSDAGSDDSSDDSDSSLQGGDGDITVTERNSGVKDEVLEGDEEVKVLGLEVEADGSDVEITSVKVTLEHTGAGSNRLDRYVDEVHVIFDGEVVGSADPSDFNESSDVYTESISVSDVIVREDDDERLYIAISAENNVDSDDLSQNWTGEVTSIRYIDADDAVLTEPVTVVSETFTFEDLASTGDVELKVTEDDNDVNKTHDVIVDDTSDTNDVEVLSFTLGAEGSDIELQTLSFGVSSTGAGVTEIANDFRLMSDGSEVGKAILDDDCSSPSSAGDGFASSTDAAVCIVVNDLDDDDVVVSEDDEIDFTLVADINDIDGAFTSGDDLSVTLNGDVTISSNGHVDADDENGDTLTVSELTGSADSTTINFLASGISVEVTDKDAVIDTKVSDEATDDVGVYTVEFEVKAIEDEAFVELGTATRGTTESNTGANFVIQDADNDYAATTTGSISLANVDRVSGGSVSGDFIKIGAGQSAIFELEVTFDPGHVTGSSEGYRLYLYSVNSAATAVDATAQQVLTPEVEYRTSPISIGN